MDLVILPFQDWKKNEREGFRERDSHLIQHFERDERVRKILVLDRPISLPEMVWKRRGWRIRKGEIVKRGCFCWLTRVSEKIFVLDIFSGDIFRPVMMRRDWWDFIFKHHRVIQKIKEAMNFLGMEKVVFFCCTPLSTGPVERLEKALFVFDANDNWLQHPSIQDRRGFIAQGYRFVKEKADLIFTNSKGLEEFFSDARAPVVKWIPMGVDPERFSEIPPEEIPADIKRISHPIVGYNGRFARRVNRELFTFLLSSMPKVSFVFIGQFLDRSWARPLFRYPNFYYLGHKHYSVYPAYLAAFDLCIIPHYVSPQSQASQLVEADLVASDSKGTVTQYQDPIKLYEYLAAGKPVVTTPIAGVERFKEYITIAHSKEEFAQGILYWLKMVKEEPEALRAKLRQAITQEHRWSTKARKMVDLMVERLKEKGVFLGR